MCAVKAEIYLLLAMELVVAPAFRDRKDAKQMDRAKNVWTHRSAPDLVIRVIKHSNVDVVRVDHVMAL